MRANCRSWSADAFPAVTTVRVKEALEAVGDIVTSLADALALIETWGKDRP